MLSIPSLCHLSCLLLSRYRLMQEVMLEADFHLNLHMLKILTPPQRRQKRGKQILRYQEVLLEDPKEALCFSGKRLLAKSAPVISEGPLPAFVSSQGCSALSCLRGTRPTQSSLPLLSTGTLGLLLPSPPTSLTHVVFSSLSPSPNCLKECFHPSLPPFASHLLCGRTHRAAALLCIHTIPLLKSCSEHELVFCSLNEAFVVPSTGSLHEHSSYVKYSKPRHTPPSSPLQPFATLLSNSQPCCASCCPLSITVSTNTPGQNCFATSRISKQHHLAVTHLLGKEDGNSCAVASRLIPPSLRCFTVTEILLLKKYFILTYANHCLTSFIIDCLLSENQSAAADAF